MERASQVEALADRTNLSFSPDLKREPTFFSGELGKSVAFREAISALHAVVTSDLRFKPKDKTVYKAWAARQQLVDYAQVAAQTASAKARMTALTQELQGLWAQNQQRSAAFFRARSVYFNHLYERDRDAWIVLDPVITVHPDEVFFECFSQDESSYGRLSASHEVFTKVGEFACGTTNIDYSHALYNEFQKIRSYKSTRLEVDPSGFQVKIAGEDEFEEKKIDLPDSWVRGFLQVSSAMSMPARRVTLTPTDVANLCFVLRRHKEKTGPRSMRWVLTPGEPVRVVFEPWNIEVVCSRSIYQGTTAEVLRLWGRRRLLILERLIPLAQSFTLHLLGQGLPYFCVADLGSMSFTLGLSGWTANDWSTAGNFDLLAPRAATDDFTKRRVFDALKQRWLARPADLATELGLPDSAVLGALGAWTQGGRAMYDLAKNVYRARELSREPLPMDKLRFSGGPEQQAQRLVDAGAVTLQQEQAGAGKRLFGSVLDGKHTYAPDLLIDADARIVKAVCTCNFFQQNKLFKGPCSHMLALRRQDAARATFLL
jgi:SWIM zinc finger